MEKQLVLCVSPYEQKYYFESEFQDLPEAIKDELLEAVAQMAEKINGIISVGFYSNGNMFIEEVSDDNVFVDDIGAALEIKRFQSEKQELIKSLKMWYMIYRTEHGKIVREVVIMQAKKMTNEAIIAEIEKKYGKESGIFAQGLLSE